MTTKRRLSASVDADLVGHDRRLRALDEFLAAYEAEHGRITDREIDQAARSGHSRAIVVRRATSGARGTSPHSAA